MRTAAPCSITARRRSSVPSTRPAANSTASSVNPSAEPSSYPQIPRTRQITSPNTEAAILARLIQIGQEELPRGAAEYRSEEHTSELQSLRHLVCRLLLEK